MLLSGKEFGGQDVGFTQHMLIEETKTLCSDATLGTAKV